MEDCTFCNIVNHNLPSTVVHDDEDVLVFKDILPKAPVHLLVIPKKHIASLNDVEGADWELVGKMHQVAREVAKQQGVAERGYQLKFNVGKEGGQVVGHLHLHLLAGKQMEA